jgi:hypothetical protein
MKISTILLTLPCTLWLSLQTGIAKEKPVSSQIDKVIVYINGAQVHRKAKTTLPAGKTELVFKEISPNIDKQSIQVKGDGNFTILNVSHQVNFLQEQTRQKEIVAIEAQKESLSTKLAIEKSMLAVFTHEESILVKNAEIKGANFNLKASELKEAVDFQRSRLTEVLLKQLDQDRNIRKLDSAINKLDKQLVALRQKKDLSTSEIVVTVSTTRDNTPAAFELSYLVEQAGWFATYDMRVKDISQPVELGFKANVYQHSGEDWKEVKLSISSGNPSESGVTPQLNAWFLRYGYPQDMLNALQGNGSIYGSRAGLGNVAEVKGKILSAEDGEPLPGANISVKGTTLGTMTDINGNYSLKLTPDANTIMISSIGFITQELPVQPVMNVTMQPDVRQLQEVITTGYGVNRALTGRVAGVAIKVRGTNSIPLETQASYQATTVNFDIEMPYTVPADGKTYKVDIQTFLVPAIYEYLAVPKLDKDAFLTAKITDWQELNLLEGEVNLFFEGAFLGRSVLGLANAGDTLQVSLGRDKGVSVERKRLKEYTRRQYIGSYKTEYRGYEITVRNNKQHPIHIIIQDQFPISTNRDISIEKASQKEGEVDDTSKKITWKADLQPKAEKKVGFNFSVKYPKAQVVVLE